MSERERWPKEAPTDQAAAAGLKRCHGEIHGLSTEAGAAALRACVILKLHKAERIAEQRKRESRGLAGWLLGFKTSQPRAVACPFGTLF